MKNIRRSFVSTLAFASLFCAAHAATLTWESTTLISSNTDFTVSVFDGKAGYAGSGAYSGVSGTFGDGTVEGYTFLSNITTGNPGSIGSYAAGGSGITFNWTAVTGFANFDLGDVWTTNDPDSQAANFGGTTETISGGYQVNGVIDISPYYDGTVYVLLGGYDTPFDLALNLNGSTPVAMDQIDPPTTRNLYVAAFSFDDSLKEHTSITYSYTGNASNRSRFMGVILDANVPEPSTAILAGLGFLGLTFRRRRLA